MDSMTGFGRARKTLKGVAVDVQLSSVNKRGREISVNLPRELDELEPSVHEKLQKAFERGKLQLSVRVQTAKTSSTDEDLKKNFTRLKAACKKLEVPFDADARLMWEMMQSTRPAEVDAKELPRCVLEGVQEAIRACQRVQAAEGKRLMKDFAARLKKMHTLRDKAATLAKNSLELQRARLIKNLENAQLSIDPRDERILKELAIFADRADVAEELTRIGSHLKAAEKLIATPGSIGRQLEFLLQEFQREWNTLGNKSAQIELIQTALAAKNEIERLREQAANVA